MRGATAAHHLVLQPQIWTEKVKAAVVVAAAGSGLMSPPPPGLRQYRFLRRVRLPDQMVEEPADLGNCHGNQGFIPFRLSPFLLLQTAFALLPDHRQVGMGQHRQSDVTVPAIPFSDFILVQPYLSFGLLEAFLYGPPDSRHQHPSGVAQMLHHLVPEVLANQTGFPAIGGQQPLYSVGCGVARLLRQLPAVFALYRRKQSL